MQYTQYSRVRKHDLYVVVGPFLDLSLQHRHKLCLEWNVQATCIVSIYMYDQDIILPARQRHLHRSQDDFLHMLEVLTLAIFSRSNFLLTAASICPLLGPLLTFCRPISHTAFPVSIKSLFSAYDTKTTFEKNSSNWRNRLHCDKITVLVYKCKHKSTS